LKKRGKITLQTRKNHGCNRTSTSAVFFTQDNTLAQNKKQILTNQKKNYKTSRLGMLVWLQSQITYKQHNKQTH
jgi:hypothetical protein